MSAKTGGKRVRDCSMHVYFKEHEHDLVREAAELAGQSASSWVRAIVLHAARRTRRQTRNGHSFGVAGVAGAEDE